MLLFYLPLMLFWAYPVCLKIIYMIHFATPFVSVTEKLKRESNKIEKSKKMKYLKPCCNISFSNVFTKCSPFSKIDPLTTTTIVFGSQEWSLFTGLIVHTIAYENHMKNKGNQRFIFSIGLYFKESILQSGTTKLCFANSLSGMFLHKRTGV